MQSERNLRIGEQIKRILATTINREIRDKELQQISITAVKVSPDLQVARVYVTSLRDQQNRVQMLQTLNNAGGFLRTKLSKNLKLRRTPTLYFVYDESIEYAVNMEILINQANSK